MKLADPLDPRLRSSACYNGRTDLFLDLICRSNGPETRMASKKILLIVGLYKIPSKIIDSQGL
jgi:hypothetical protein